MSSVLGAWGVVFTLTGILLTFAIPWNTHVVSASYIIFSSGVVALTILVCYLLVDVLKIRFPLLGAVGRNALALYILSSLLILGLNAILPVGAPLFSVVVGLGAVLALSILTGVMLDRRKLYIRL
jgi:predicted acyltransferase